MEINKESLRNFRVQFAKAVENLETELGVKISLTNISFGPDSFRTKLEVINTNGKNVEEIKNEKEVKEFNMYHEMYGLKVEWLNKDFNMEGTTFKLIGLNIKKRKNPCIIQRADGKRFICPIRTVSSRFETAKEKAEALQNRCPDCGALPGTYHKRGCDQGPMNGYPAFWTGSHDD